MRPPPCVCHNVPRISDGEFRSNTVLSNAGADPMILAHTDSLLISISDGRTTESSRLGSKQPDPGCRLTRGSSRRWRLQWRSGRRIPRRRRAVARAVLGRRRCTAGSVTCAVQWSQQTRRGAVARLVSAILGGPRSARSRPPAPPLAATSRSRAVQSRFSARSLSAATCGRPWPVRPWPFTCTDAAR